MKKLHQAWKVTVIGFLMLVHALLGSVAALLLNEPQLRSFRLNLAQRHSRIALAVLGVKLELLGEENWRTNQNYLVVANHLSYLDILLFASFRPLVFVSTMEVKNTPVLGRITAAAGSLFVERRSRENLRSEISMIEKTLKEGFSLAFFPEGTSTNGSSVLPFKRPFFAPAQEARVPVLPVVVQPLEIDGQKVSSANRDKLCWYGDMTFFPHLFALAGCDHLKIQLKILPELKFPEQTKREQLASAAHTAILENFQPLA